jgi:hypothetical protein
MFSNNSFYILDIDKKFNSDILPIYLNDNEIVDNVFNKFDEFKYLRSQYSLEIVLHDMFKQHKNLVNNYENSSIVFIPIYLFCSAWVKKYFYNVNQIIDNLNLISPLINKCINDGKKIIIVYSDVMWEDKRCFLNHFNFHKNIYFICYEDVISENNQIPVPYCTHIKKSPKEYTIPKNHNKKYLISYAGRYREEINFFNDIEVINTNKIMDEKWISINNADTYNIIDELYLNSYFSLQPHGDKKSRKGFYHSLLLGCVPVVFDDNYSIYEKIFNDIIDIEDITVIINKNEKNYEDKLKKELINIDRKINNIDKIKHLLLYDENDLSIVDYILNKIKNYE